MNRKLQALIGATLALGAWGGSQRAARAETYTTYNADGSVTYTDTKTLRAMPHAVPPRDAVPDPNSVQPQPVNRNTRRRQRGNGVTEYYGNDYGGNGYYPYYPPAPNYGYGYGYGYGYPPPGYNIPVAPPLNGTVPPPTATVIPLGNGGYYQGYNGYPGYGYGYPAPCPPNYGYGYGYPAYPPANYGYGYGYNNGYNTGSVTYRTGGLTFSYGGGRATGTLQGGGVLLGR